MALYVSQMMRFFYIAKDSHETVKKIEDENEKCQASIYDHEFAFRYEMVAEDHTSSDTESTKKDIEHIVQKTKKKMHQHVASKNPAYGRH